MGAPRQGCDMGRFVRLGISTPICFAAALWVASAVIAPASAGEAAAKDAEISFSMDQAKRGETAYVENCVMCHGYHLNDGEFGPPIKGSFFQGKWSGKSVGEFYALTIMTMPQSNPDSLDPETYADILAYVFEVNGLKPGGKDLPLDASALDSVPLPW
jgi:polar amino acid transport system substrate-binding protein